MRRLLRATTMTPWRFGAPSRFRFARGLSSEVRAGDDDVGKKDELLLELESDRRKAIHMLVANFTAPALASALVDRERILARCARYLNEGRDADLAEILAQFEVATPGNDSPQLRRRESIMPDALTPKVLASIEAHLSRLPRVYQGVTGPLERRASVLIPLCHDNGVPSILFTRRAETLNRDAGQVCFPGGMIDDSDFSVKEAALREVEEETGISREDIQTIGVLRCDWSELVSLTGVAVTPIVAMLKKDVSDLRIDPNPQEVDHWFTVPLTELDEDALWVRKRTSERVYSPVFNSRSMPNATVWGFTAYIADRLMRKVVRRAWNNSGPGLLDDELKAAIGSGAA